jgi:2-amino-4-hydroxy-6-hydroxymethyldihydropteridine diphosphokinase
MTDGIYLLLGTNMGERQEQLAAACAHISRFASIVRKSSVYSTKAWGNTAQPDFLNQVLEVATQLDPEMLLLGLLATEAKMGRTRKEKWGPRPIDIDLLLYNDRIIKLPSLTVPHPEMHNRKFTLVPLRELSPELIHPLFRKTISILDDECSDSLPVTNVESM